jgi:outer membrane protein assembly factor BamA
VKQLKLFFFLLFSITAVGQKRYTLELKKSETFENFDKKQYKQKDSLTVLKILQEKQLKLIKKGNVLASVDSIVWKGNTVVAQIFTGPKFTTARIEIEEKDKSLVSNLTRFYERSLLRLPIEADLLGNSLQSISKSLNNKGYPFAKVYLTKIHFEGEVILAKLVIDKGKLIKWNKIEIKGDAQVSEKLMATFLNVEEGNLFSLKDFDNVGLKIKQLPYVVMIKAPELLLTENSATLYIYLKSNQISLINGILGLQQRPSDFKVQFTGDLRIKLQNTFHKGELIDVQWRSIQPLSQQLKMQTTLPFLFKTNFGLDASFELFKRDTSFLELKTNLGILYQLGSSIRLKAFYKRQSSNVLKGISTQPDFVSVSTNNYGLQFFSQVLDYVPNPRKGYLFNVEGSTGLRQSKSLDTSIAKKSTTYSIQLIANYYFPIALRNVIKLSVNAQSYYAPNIYRNEALRFGGQNSQRGFNEDVLLSTTRATASIEYHFLLDRNSYLFAFFDQSWYEQNITTYYSDTPSGFGIGMTFGTNVGVFSISYAMGNQKGSELLLKNGKMHFGYIAFF